MKFYEQFHAELSTVQPLRYAQEETNNSVENNKVEHVLGRIKSGQV